MLCVGDIARRVRTVSKRDIELFTELTGDRNPLHYDEAAASECLGHVLDPGEEVVRAAFDQTALTSHGFRWAPTAADGAFGRIE